MVALRAARRWLSTQHSPAAEAALVAGFYATYEATRGLAAGSRESAIHRAQQIIRLERTYHLYAEPQVQRLAGSVPGLLRTLGIAYLTLHLAVTVGLLIWLYRRRPGAFPLVRTTLIIASVLSLIGFLVFPTAPPRMADTALGDTVSHAAINLNHGLISSLYNPYAALPSMHTAYALVVAFAVTRYGHRISLRVAGAIYSPFVLLVIIATGNHFFFDAAVGALVAAASAAIALRATRTAPKADLVAFAQRAPATTTLDRAA